MKREAMARVLRQTVKLPVEDLQEKDITYFTLHELQSIFSYIKTLESQLTEKQLKENTPDEGASADTQSVHGSRG